MTDAEFEQKLRKFKREQRIRDLKATAPGIAVLLAIVLCFLLLDRSIREGERERGCAVLMAVYYGADDTPNPILKRLRAWKAVQTMCRDYDLGG